MMATTAVIPSTPVYETDIIPKVVPKSSSYYATASMSTPMATTTPPESKSMTTTTLESLSDDVLHDNNNDGVGHNDSLLFFSQTTRRNNESLGITNHGISQSPYNFDDDGCSLIVPFPRKLHHMLDDSEKEGFTSIVSWLPAVPCNVNTSTNSNHDDRACAFKVHDPDLFVSTIMPRYFKQTQYRSFQRQLNIWGFYRLHHPGLHKGAYSHRLFVRGEPSLCANMQRQYSATKKKKRSRRSSSQKPKHANRANVGSSSKCRSTCMIGSGGSFLRTSIVNENGTPAPMTRDDDEVLTGQNILESIAEIIQMHSCEGRKSQASLPTANNIISEMLLKGNVHAANRPDKVFCNNPPTTTTMYDGGSRSSSSSPSAATMHNAHVHEEDTAAPSGYVNGNMLRPSCGTTVESLFSQEEEEEMSHWALDQVSMGDSLLSAIMAAEEQSDEEDDCDHGTLHGHKVDDDDDDDDILSPNPIFPPPMQPSTVGWQNVENQDRHSTGDTTRMMMHVAQDLLSIEPNYIQYINE